MTQTEKKQSRFKKSHDALPSNAKPIPSHPTYYATENGEIWRVSPERKVLNGGVVQKRIIKLNQTTNANNGYKQCQPYVDGKRKMRYVHRLVLEAFKGTPKGKRNICHHKDENRTNNHIDNLMWCSYKENSSFIDRSKIKMPKYGEGRKQHKVKYSAELLNHLLDLAEAGFKNPDICFMLDVPYHVVANTKYVNKHKNRLRK